MVDCGEFTQIRCHFLKRPVLRFITNVLSVPIVLRVVCKNRWCIVSTCGSFARKKKGYLLVSFLFYLLQWDSNIPNATVRWTVACRRLDGGNTLRFFPLERIGTESHYPPRRSTGSEICRRRPRENPGAAGGISFFVVLHFLL